MPSDLRLFTILGDQQNEVVAASGNFLSIGRDPENVIVIDAEGISRRHGCLLEAGTQWIYSDTGSTNGSWINGIQVEAYQFRVVRHGDVLQLVNFPLQIYLSEHAETAPPSLLALLGERFEREITLPPVGGKFRIGGVDAELPISGRDTEERICEIEVHNHGLELKVVATDVPVMLNNSAVLGSSNLVDRDTLQIGSYIILVNDLRTSMFDERQNHPGAGSSPKNVQNYAVYDRFNRPDHVRIQIDGGWESESGRRKIGRTRALVFGALANELDPTDTMVLKTRDSSGKVGFEVSPLHRFSGVHPHFNPDAMKEHSSDKWMLLGLVVVVGFVLTVLVYFLIAGAL